MGRKKLSVRKQPRQERSVATVEAILQAATYILTRRGWSAFTTNEVAERAGVNIASLYQYFPNKESLVAELQRRHVELLRAQLQTRVSSKHLDSLEQACEAVLKVAVEEHRMEPSLHRVFAEELPRSIRTRAFHGETESLWTERIEPWIRAPDVGLATFIARVTAHAVIHEAAIEKPELLDHPLFVSELVRMLAGYLKSA